MENQSAPCPTLAQIESIASGISVSDRISAHIARCERCAENIRLARFGKQFERVMSDQQPDIGLPSADYPEIFGYSILGVIARGGQGVVYHAVQDTTGQEVAIKVLDPTLTGLTRQARERMSREIHIVGSLNHPGIVRVLDSLKLSDGREALVMEYIRGDQLNQWLLQNPDRSEPYLLELLAGIADAVHHAHQRGIIHRDLKPSNIMIGEDGRVRVLDFGVARWADLLDEDSHITRTGEFAGTLAYAAPEQVSTESVTPDIRTDIYSMGVIGFETLTGQEVFKSDGSLQSMIESVLTSQPPNRAQSGLKTESWTVLSKAMAKDKSRRYQSAGEFAGDLRRAARGEAVHALGDSQWYLLRKAVRKNRVLLSFILMISVAISGVLVSLAIGNSRLSEALRASRIVQIRALLAAGNREQAEEVFWGEFERRIRSGFGSEHLLWNGSAHDMELFWCFVEMQSSATCMYIQPDRYLPRYGLWSIEGGSFLTVDSDRWLVRLTRTTSGIESERVFVIPDRAETMKVTPDGRYMLCFGDDRVWCVDIATNESVSSRGLGGIGLQNLVISFANWGFAITDSVGEMRVLSVPGLDPIIERSGLPVMLTPWLDPDERVIGFIDHESRLRVMDIGADQELPPSGAELFGTQQPGPYPQIVLSPDRNQIIMAYGGGLLVLDTDKGTQSLPIMNHPGYRVWVGHDPGWSVMTAIASGDPALHLWNTATWESLPGLPGHAGSVVTHSFTSDSSEILTIDARGTLRVWASPLHSWRFRLGPPSSQAHQFAVDPSNKNVYSLDSNGKLLQLPIPTNESILNGLDVVPSISATRVALDEGGEYLAVANMKDTVELIVLKSGTRIRIELPDQTNSIAGLQCRPEPNKPMLAVAVNPAGLVLIDTSTGRAQRAVSFDSTALISSMDWSPDGRRVVVSLRDGTLGIVDDIERDGVRVVDLKAIQLRSLSFLPDGVRVVAVGETGKLYVVHLDSGEVRESKRLSEHSLFCVEVHPEGRIAMVGDRAGNVMVVDLRSLTELATFDAGGSVMWMEFMDGGRSLVVSAIGCPIEIWRFADLAETMDKIAPE